MVYKEIIGHINESVANKQASGSSGSCVVESMKTVVVVARKL